MAFFQKPVIGIDISDRSIEAVLILRKGDRYVVSSYGRTELPPGLIVDGFVERREEAAVILRKLLSDQMTPPLPRGAARAVLALPESQVYSHIFEVPRVADDAELGRSLAVEADGYFPYNHQEMTAGYTVTALRPDKKEIFYAAVHRDTLLSFLSLLAAAGLSPAAVEGESTSIARATLPIDENDPVVFVDIGARVTNISVFDRNGIQFSETLETAGDAFTTALSRTLALPPDDAEALKQNHGLSEQLDLRAQKALRTEVDRLISDVRAAIQYYEERSKRLVTRVLVCGGSIMMPGLLEALTERLPTTERGYKVELADPWAGLMFDERLEKLGIRTRGVLVATAVGLAMRGVGIRKFPEIDFLPGLALQSVKKGRGAAKQAAAVVAAPDVVTRPSFASTRRRWPLWLKAAAAVATILMLAAGVWATVYLIVPLLKKTAAPAAAPAPAEIALEVRASVGDAFSVEQSRLMAVPIDVEIPMEKAYAREGTRRDGLAKGVVTLNNETGAAQPLVANTRLLSAGGVLFRLDDRATIPAGGRVQAAVTADQPGAQGDVPAGRFTIPGLSPSQQRVIYGESTEAMRGGVIFEGAPFTTEELEKARLEFAAEAEATLYQAAVEKAGDEYLILTDLMKADVRIDTAPSLGQPTGDYVVKATLLGQVLALSKEEIGTIVRNALVSRPETGGDASGWRLSEPTVEVVEADIEQASATLIVRSTAVK